MGQGRRQGCSFQEADCPAVFLLDLYNYTRNISYISICETVELGDQLCTVGRGGRLGGAMASRGCLGVKGEVRGVP